MFKTIDEMLDYRASTHPERPALSFEGSVFTYAELGEMASAMAEGLKKRGVGEGDRVAVLELNTPEVIGLTLGAVKIGAVPVLLNWRSVASEVAFVLRDARPRLFLYGAPWEGIVGQACGEGDITSIPISEWVGTLEAPDGRPTEGNPSIREDDVFVQIYTSGTTGDPKGVLLSHGNILCTMSALAMETPGFGADTVSLICAPLYNIAGIGISLLGFYIGGMDVLVRQFDPVEVAKRIEAEKVTYTFLAPAMMQAVMAVPGVEERDFSSLRNIQYGGSPMAPSLLRRASDMFRCHFTQGYGLTETGGIATLLRYDEHERCLAPEAPEEQTRRLGSAGKPIPGVRLAIKDNDGRDVAVGALGEVCIQGPNVMTGYWRSSETGAPSVDGQGWFHSGDIGRLDADGFLYLFDRKNDMIVSKGINIYPAEVEKVLIEHPDILEVAVIGVPDEEYGETVSAVVITRDDKDLEVTALRDWSRERLAGYKLPRRIVKVAELPKNPSGKVLRRTLREPFWVGRERRVQ